MEQRDYWRNITGTACVVGVALSAMSFNSTQSLVKVETELVHNSGFYAEYNYSDTETINTIQGRKTNCYIHEDKKPVLDEAQSLFGTMRDATEAELLSVNDYIRSISIETGANFFNLC